MTAPTWILPLFLAGSLGVVYQLPESGEVAQAAVRMELPDRSGEWIFRKTGASQAELDALAKDTEFSKAVCLRPRPGEITADGYLIPDRLDLSIVLSGYDLNNSIHRPERCMPAQGHNIISSGNVLVKLKNGREFTAKRLISIQTIPTNEARTEHVDYHCVTYYFFVGHDRIMHDHLGRTLIDMKDRIVRGLDQRWAYASTSMWYGKLPNIGDEVTREEADAKVQEFLAELAEKQIIWEQIAL